MAALRVCDGALGARRCHPSAGCGGHADDGSVVADWSAWHSPDPLRVRSPFEWRTATTKGEANAPQPIESRVEHLEHRVTKLERLPRRIDDLTAQISQLRAEMRAEFSAVRGEMAEQGTTIIATLRGEMAEQGAALRGEMARQFGELATQMGVLHEDVISRIARLQEGWSGTPRRRPRKK